MDKYISISQAADIAGVHYQTIRNWIYKGRLPAYRPGGRDIRIKASELEGLFQSARVQNENR